jgi:hypothetical protein
MEAAMAWRPPRKSISDTIIFQEPSASGSATNRVTAPEEITFEWDDLVLSLARTTTLATPIEGLSQEERREFALTLAEGAAGRIDLVVEKGNPEFCFSNRLALLADNLRTSVAGEVGAAIADLTMESMGFHWRANGREVGFVVPAGVKKKDKRLPDFVYDPGAAGGFAAGQIAAVEAKGTLAKLGGRRASVSRLAKAAFHGQVAKYLGGRASGCEIAAGFAVAYGSVPGSNASTLAVAGSHEFQTAKQPVMQAVSLSAAASGELQPERQQVEVETEFEEESQQKKQKQPVEIEYGNDHSLEEVEEVEIEAAETGDSGRGGGDERGGDGGRRRGNPSRRIAFANYEAVFQMAGAFEAARFIRSRLSGETGDAPDAGEPIQSFYVIEGEEPILLGTESWFGRWSNESFARIGIAAASAEEILGIVAMSDELPSSIELGIVPPDRRRIRAGGVDAALQSDGLALLRDWGTARSRRWDLRAGRWLD